MRRMLEAYRNTVVVVPRGEMRMHLGHDASGVPLEVGVVETREGSAIVHAMRLRRVWRRLYARHL